MPTSAEPTGLFDAQFEPYAREIGFLLRNWNDLQEMLANLFGTILDDRTGVSRAIWYAVPNDRLQRIMLRKAAEHVFSAAGSSDNSVILKEICWIIDKSDSLGRQRDAAAHSPVSLLIAEPLEFIARYFHGNPLAESLKGKKLLTEFQLYRERAVILHDYAKEIEQWLGIFQRRPTWPSRPPWPTRAPPGARRKK